MRLEDSRFELIGKGLLVKLSDGEGGGRGRRILAIADLHLGFEDALIESGILLPRFQFKETIRDLKEIFSKIEGENGEKGKKVDEIVVLGDLKDLFGTIAGQEWEEVLEMIDFLKKHCGKIVLLKGNHDVQLEPIARRKGLRIMESYVADDICFFHGNRKLGKEEMERAKVFVIGHMHPAIVLREGNKREMFKAFLAGNYDGGKFGSKKVIILPSFIPLVEGKTIGQDSDVLEDRGRFLNLKLKISEFEAYIIGEEGRIYRFGKVGDLED